jgi:hypothetical protein
LAKNWGKQKINEPFSLCGLSTEMIKERAEGGENEDLLEGSLWYS